MKNPLSVFKNDTERYTAYMRDSVSKPPVMAYYENLTKIPLKEISWEKVDFIGGVWRVQNQLKYTIQNVRDRQFILFEKLKIRERNLFEFWRAAPVEWNCYGPFISTANLFVARYDTDQETYLAYGKTIEEARAFMGIKLYDVYQDLIHSVACRKNAQHL